MAVITLIVADTPAGGVSISSDYHPKAGDHCTAAQGHALALVNKTRKEWGVSAAAAPNPRGMQTVEQSNIASTVHDSAMRGEFRRRAP